MLCNCYTIDLSDFSWCLVIRLLKFVPSITNQQKNRNRRNCLVLKVDHSACSALTNRLRIDHSPVRVWSWNRCNIGLHVLPKMQADPLLSSSVELPAFLRWALRWMHLNHHRLDRLISSIRNSRGGQALANTLLTEVDIHSVFSMARTLSERPTAVVYWVRSS